MAAKKQTPRPSAAKASAGKSSTGKSSTGKAGAAKATAAKAGAAKATRAKTAAVKPAKPTAALAAAAETPAPPPDPRQRWIQLLRDVQAAHGAKPEVTARERARHDAWGRILGSSGRYARIEARLEDLAGQDQWVFDAQDRALRLTGKGWREALHVQLGVIHADLLAAQGDYARARVRWEKPTLFGVLKGTNVGPGSEAEIAKQHEEAQKLLAKLAEAQKKAFVETLQTILDDWAARRTALARQEAAFREAYLATMRAEEDFLRAVPAPSAPAAEALDGLRRARLDLVENLDWGDSLRLWREARTKARKALGVPPDA